MRILKLMVVFVWMAVAVSVPARANAEITVDGALAQNFSPYAGFSGTFALKERVAQVLIYDPFIEEYEIRLTVLDGVVTLTGVINDAEEKTRAEALVAKVEGVQKVDNRLIVGHGR